MGFLAKFKRGVALGRADEVSASRKVVPYEENKTGPWGERSRGGNFPAPAKSRQDQPRIIRRKIYSPRAVIVQNNATFIFEDYQEYSEWEE
jgi:hypothetical protein